LLVVSQPDHERQVPNEGVEAVIGQDETHAQPLRQGEVKAVVEGTADLLGGGVRGGDECIIAVRR
jgi:hypothetical protein